MSHIFRTWMDEATPQEKRDLADLAGTTVAALRQAAGGYRTGGDVDLSPEFAIRIAEGIAKLTRRGLPKVKQEHLSTTCATCPLRRCTR